MVVVIKGRKFRIHWCTKCGKKFASTHRRTALCYDCATKTFLAQQKLHEKDYISYEEFRKAMLKKNGTKKLL